MTLVNGNHGSCQLGPRGWHRHYAFGQRRLCRRWIGGGKQPDFCIKAGAFLCCDY